MIRVTADKYEVTGLCPVRELKLERQTEAPMKMVFLNVIVPRYLYVCSEILAKQIYNLRAACSSGILGSGCRFYGKQVPFSENS